LLVAPIQRIRIQGIKETLELLDAVQPGAIKELRKDIRKIAQPVVSAIKANVPTTSPLTGMNHYGRTRFAGAKVTAELLLRGWGNSDTIPLARLAVVSPKLAAGLEIADMAGRKTMMNGPALKYEYKGRGRIGGSGRQKPTRSRSVVRRGNSAPFSYRINGQGKGMTDNLGGIPSRYVYPALAQREDTLAADMLKTIESYTERINQKIRIM
jgi:hypothetical protein